MTLSPNGSAPDGASAPTRHPEASSSPAAPGGPWDDIHLLEVLSQRDSIRLYGLGIRQQYRSKGLVVFHEGERCEGLHILLSGRVRLFRTSPHGRTQVVRYVEPGAAFNAVPVFDGGRNPVTASTVEASEMLLIPREAVLQVVSESPEAAGAMIQIFSRRLRQLVSLVDDLSFRHVSGRIARILLQAVSPHAGVGAGMVAVRSVSQRELASIAGTSREVVARSLRVMEDQGAIAIERGKIRLVDVGRLSRIADGP